MEWWRQALHIIVVYGIAIYATIKQLLTGCNEAEDLERNDGKVAIVTGGSSGIGLEVVKTLSKAGMHVIIGSLDADKGKKACNFIKGANALAKVDWIPLDLSSLDSVRKFVSAFLEKKLPLHVLVNNAGVMMTPYRRTGDDFEHQFQVNYLGHFLLSRLLLDTLHASAQPRSYARIVNVSSIVHFGGSLDASHLRKTMPVEEYSPCKAYADSKLAVVLGTQELQRRLYGAGRRVTVNSLHPGVVSTALYQHLHPLLQAGRIVFSQLGLMWTKKKGSATCVYAALSAEMEGVGGCYLDNCQSVASSSPSYERKLQRALWQESCDWCGLPRDIASHRALRELASKQQNGHTR